MRVVGVACIVVAAACGPGLARKSGHAIAEDSLVDASGNAAALERLMRGQMMNGGLWFADASCAPFATPGPIAREKIHAFAGCLAGLHWQGSARVDALPDVTVLTYAPGIELEARVVLDGDGPRLTWIGFESRRDDADSLPTISPALLESLRVAGEAHPTMGDPKAYAWFKLCVGADGSIADVTPFSATSLRLVRDLEPTLATWKFKTSPVGPSCAVLFLGKPPQPPLKLSLPVPPRSRDAPIDVDSRTLHRVRGAVNIVPDDDTKTEIGRDGPRRVVGSFRVCIGPTGQVASVVPLRSTGVPAYDAKIMREIKGSWAYEPYRDGDHAVPICTVDTFIYSQY